MIPYVTALGDALEQAIAARRRRRRIRFTAGVLTVAVAASGAAAASGIFNDPEPLAAGPVGCYDRADLAANVAVLGTGERSPVDTCREVLGTDGPLSACAADQHVAVFPGRNACEKLGLAPLPAGYAPARERVNALARDVAALERAADCISPDEMARRVQALLDHSGWTGWRTWRRRDLDDGPCGSVTMLNGDGTRSLEGALDSDGRRVMVVGGGARSTTDLLYEQGLAGELMDASGERCYTRPALERMVRGRLGEHALTLTSGPSDAELGDARGRRREQGCAIVADVRPADDGRGVVVAIDN